MTFSCTAILIMILQKYSFDIFWKSHLILFHTFIISSFHPSIISASNDPAPPYLHTQVPAPSKFLPLFSSCIREQLEHHKSFTIVSSISLRPLSTGTTQKKTFSKHITGSTTHNIKFFSNTLRVLKPAIHFWNFFELQVVQPVMCFKIFYIVGCRTRNSKGASQFVTGSTTHNAFQKTLTLRFGKPAK